MRKIIVSMMMTVDGYFAGPNGGISINNCSWDPSRFGNIGD